MIENIPDWADRKCDCGAYLDETDVTYTINGEEYCEGCKGAIMSVDSPEIGA